ncbi:MAG: hypothetical protein WCC30_09415, partial [Candidatus Dormiibacterota bacterium]
APAIRFAADQTRPTTFERLLRCLTDLGGVTREILTDRDVAFCEFRANPITRSGRIRSPIPGVSDHPGAEACVAPA